MVAAEQMELLRTLARSGMALHSQDGAEMGALIAAAPFSAGDASDDNSDLRQ